MSDTSNVHPGCNKNKAPAGVWGNMNKFTILLLIGIAILALVFYHQKEKTETQLEISHQYIVAGFLKSAREDLDKAAQHVSALNFGNAKVSISQTLIQCDSTQRVLGQWGGARLLGGISTHLKTAWQKTDSMQPDALAAIQAAKAKIQTAEMTVAGSSIRWARVETRRGNRAAAQAFLTQAATLFEDAGKVEGMQSQDWVDDVIRALGKAQKAVNDVAEKATPVIDETMKTIQSKLPGR